MSAFVPWNDLLEHQDLRDATPPIPLPFVEPYGKGKRHHCQSQHIQIDIRIGEVWQWKVLSERNNSGTFTHPHPSHRLREPGWDCIFPTRTDWRKLPTAGTESDRSRRAKAEPHTRRRRQIEWGRPLTALVALSPVTPGARHLRDNQ